MTCSVFSTKMGLDWEQPSPIAGFSKKNHTLVTSLFLIIYMKLRKLMHSLNSHCFYAYKQIIYICKLTIVTA